MSAFDYARQQFDLAVSNMAVDERDLPARIYSAYLTIHAVKDEAFQGSDDLRHGWNDLKSMLKAAEAETNSLERGLNKIEDADVRALAEQIVLMAGRLRHHEG